MEVTPGMMLTQAARRSSTRERAMRSASSWEMAVVRTRRLSVAGTVIAGNRVQGDREQGPSAVMSATDPIVSTVNEINGIGLGVYGGF
jgi:hypothetical protein